MSVLKTFLRGLAGSIPQPFRNRYAIVAIIFLAWMLLFDSANLVTQFKLVQSVNNLKRDKEYYKEAIIKAEAEKKTLAEDKETFAREQYYMQKDNEEVFILEKEE